MIAAAEASFLEHDAVLVRSFDALARNDSAGSTGIREDPRPAGRVAEPDRTPEPPVARAPGARPRRTRPRRMRDRLLIAALVVGLCGVLMLGGWVIYTGDPVVQLLTCMALMPVLTVIGYALVVRIRSGGRNGR